MREPSMRFVTYLVDDDAAVLRGLQRLLRSAGYEPRPYSSPAEFLAQFDPSISSCVVMDLSMPEIDGLTLQQALAERYPGQQVIFLSGTADIPHSVYAMKAGAVDFLTKPVDGKQLLAAVERARERDEAARRARREQDAFGGLIARLTPRERQVLEHVVLGQLNKQIAATLGTVEKTIKVHRSRVMAKLEVHNVAELVRLTERGGLMPRE
jgi:FixJ family two-component response regulator